MSKTILIVAGLAIIAVIGYFATRSKAPSQQTKIGQETNIAAPTYSTPKKTPHFETSAPTHGTLLAAPPINIVIDFNFDLHAKSSISVTKDGKEFALGTTTIDDNKLTLRRAFDTSAPDGVYTVNYTACWPDGSCHDGNHQFAIDRSTSSSFIDMTGRKEVTIKMSQIKFKPMEIRISKGTKVTWVNDDSVEHFVNTETHPAHTYFSDQNSRGLKKGESFSTTFDKVGFYPYHCSAHVPQNMRAAIVVI